MLPATPTNDTLNGTLTYTISQTQIFGGFSGVVGADLSNGIFCQKSVSMARTSSRLGVFAGSAEGLETMNNILLGGDNFEVSNSVVVFDAVNVVDVVPIGDDSDERLCNKPMDFKSFDIGGTRISANDGVTILVTAPGDNTATTTDDPAFAGDLVSAFDVLPSFHNNLHTG